MSSEDSPNPWTPYNTYDCSQGICSMYCPQWCELIFSPPPPPPKDTTATFSPLIIVVAAILTTTFIFFAYYTIISRYFNNNNNDNDDNNNNPDRVMNNDPPQESSKGLDLSVIRSIKISKYEKKGVRNLVEGTDCCSVCLSEFEENEDLRMLPKCKHAFHVPCIDTWLVCHSTCPLCRCNVDLVLSSSNVSSLECRMGRSQSVLFIVRDLEVVVREEASKNQVEDNTDTESSEQGHVVIDIRRNDLV